MIPGVEGGSKYDLYLFYFLRFFSRLSATKNLFNKSEYDYEVLCFELFIKCFSFIFLTSGPSG